MFKSHEDEREFCDFMEYWICEYFRRNVTDETIGFWCDGVLFEVLLTKTTALFTAFVGKTGQDKYKLSLHFVEALLEDWGNDVKSRLPKPSDYNSLCIDCEKRTMAVYLK